MKKLNKLAVKVLSVVLSIILLSSQSVFAETWTGHTVIDGAAHYKDDNAHYDNAYSEGSGGAFEVEPAATLEFTGKNAHFIKNIAKADGGAIYNNNGTVIVGNIGAEFTENTAGSYGGAISNDEEGKVYIQDNAKFTGNTAKIYGGAICNDGTVKIGANAEFTNNCSEEGNGGAIRNRGTFTIENGAIFKNNTAKGNGGAIDNRNSGIVNLSALTNDIEFTGNKQKVGTEDEESIAIYNNGTINLAVRESANIIFNDRIIGDSSAEININQPSGMLPKTGKVILNEDMSGYRGITKFYGGTIELGEKGKWFGGDFSVENSATIDMANGICGEHNFNKITLNNNLKLVVDADLENEKMDTINATKFEGEGKITVGKVKIIKDTEEKEVTITFADNKLKDKVEFSGNVETLKYKYTATYDNTTGAFTFVNEGGINMASAASAVASSVGGYATQSMVINQAFAGIDRQMAQKVQPKSVAPKATVKPSQESSLTPTDKKQPVKTNGKQNKKSANINSSNLYVSAGNQIFDDSTTIERSLWLRPFALQETIKLNGVDIDNTLYGTLAGIDLPVGQDKQLSFYIGYAGSKQEFDEVKTNQTGYLVGLTGMLVKEKWYLGVTVNGIFNKVSADSEDETNDFDMNMFTIGAKAGYNIDLSDKWILEPNITVMYGIANSDSYQTSLGSIDSQSTSNILVEPQVKAKWQLTNGWQPYGLVGYSANLSGKPKVKAGGEELELDSIDGFVEYGVGVHKDFVGTVWSCYAEVTGRSGGRNGVGGNLGIKYKF